MKNKYISIYGEWIFFSRDDLASQSFIKYFE